MAIATIPGLFFTLGRKFLPTKDFSFSFKNVNPEFVTHTDLCIFLFVNPTKTDLKLCSLLV